MNKEKYVLMMAKEITIAKLTTSPPKETSKEVGKAIGEMFKAIYNEILSIVEDSEE